MATTLRQIESLPEAYPTEVPFGLSVAALDLDHAAIWSRIEAWVAHRWTPREVVWTVEGEGDWTPPLTPATITGVEVWEHGAWGATTLPEGPYGHVLPGDGPYRITATVGGGNVPQAALEAFRRLAEYLADDAPHLSATSVEVEDGDVGLNIERSVTWMARALAYSGAADLLRPYRRTP